MPLNYWMLKRSMDLKSILFLMVFGSILGNTLYGLGALTNSKWTLLAARSLIGVCQCQIAGPVYIAKAVGIRRRSRVMFMFATSTAVAFTTGPLLAGLLVTFLKETRIHNLVLDSDTIPGWFMATLYLLYLLKVFFIFENPPPESADRLPRPSNATQEEPMMSCGLLVCYWAMFAGPMANTMCEVFGVKLAQQWWGWTVEASGYYMALVMALVIPLSLGSGRLTDVVEDRRGLRLACAAGAACSALLYDFGYGSTRTYAAVLFIGLVLYQGAACVVRSYVYAMVSKLVPASRKPLASALMMSALTVGRGTGSVLGALLGPTSFAVAQTALFCATLLLVVCTYSHLEQHAKAT